QQRAPAERIHGQPAPRSLHANHEVPGQPDALHLEPRAAADLYVDEREGDRNPGTAVDHLVQVAVARVVVLLAVAAEAELLEQVVVERHNGALRGLLVL